VRIGKIKTNQQQKQTRVVTGKSKRGRHHRRGYYNSTSEITIKNAGDISKKIQPHAQSTVLDAENP